MPLKKLFGSLFHARPKTSEEASDKAAFMAECIGSSPADLQALVISEQKSLEQEVKEAITAIQFEADRLSKRIATLPVGRAPRETAALREAQDSLRRLMRRYAASLKRTEELERELELWQQRADEEGDEHADHPRIRAEIARSELKSRGVQPVPRRLPDSAVEGLHVLDRALAKGPRRFREEEPEAIEEIDYQPHPDTAYLIQAIREATAEAERWHGHYSDEPQEMAEAVDQVHQVRRLHAALKELDRRAGVSRDRLSLGMRMQGFDL